MLAEHLLPAGHQAKGFTHISKYRRGHAMITNNPNSTLVITTKVWFYLVPHAYWLWLCPMISAPESRLIEQSLSGALPALWPKERKIWQTIPGSDTCSFAHNSLAKTH